MKNKLSQRHAKAVDSHREVLAATKAVVAEWARRHAGTRDLEAAAMLQLLAETSNDLNGDVTLQICEAIFEEFVEVMSPVVAHQIGALCDSAHAVGRSRGVRYVH